MKNVKFVNLTPHEIVVYMKDDIEQMRIPPSGKVARVSVIRQQVKEIEGIPVYNCEFGNVEGIPEPKEGVIYIVSTLVRQALTRRGEIRADVIAPDTSPDSVVRDKEGKTIGVRAFQYV